VAVGVRDGVSVIVRVAVGGGEVGVLVGVSEGVTGVFVFDAVLVRVRVGVSDGVTGVFVGVRVGVLVVVAVLVIVAVRVGVRVMLGV
jgi:hypothetical protein